MMRDRFELVHSTLDKCGRRVEMGVGVKVNQTIYLNISLLSSFISD